MQFENYNITKLYGALPLLLFIPMFFFTDYLNSIACIYEDNEVNMCLDGEMGIFDFSRFNGEKITEAKLVNLSNKEEEIDCEVFFYFLPRSQKCEIFFPYS
jgi:hypothetical protein